MANRDEQDVLKKYAQVAKNKIIASQADLEVKDRVMPQMFDWCRRQQDIIVLKSGVILTSNPISRSVQNCKIVMISKGLTPGRVLAATPELIQVLFSNAEAEQEHQRSDLNELETVSTQQQRLRLLVREAMAAGASDIHIEVRPDVARIRFRRHGELYLHTEWLPRLGREIASVAFNKETDHAITHFNPMISQNASMPLEIDGRQVRLRLASLPAHGGFDVVMRLLTLGDEEVYSLEELGYSPEQAALIKKAVMMPHGAVIVSGPTGSGKTTTLASAMALIGAERKVYTIEDPVEKVIRWATQVPVNTEHDDRGFANMGRATLRMDPDVIVLGEMRDQDTAQVMVRASITGHLVFSTLHTNTATAIITRLVDIGISPSLLSDPNLLVCLICQRLLPKLCDHCAVPLMQSISHEVHLSRWKKALGEQNMKNMRARGTNCTYCNGLGISGRTVVAEIIWVDAKAREFIQKSDVLGWEKYLRSKGWKNYHDHAISLAKQGVCDLLDVEKIVGEISATSAE